MLDYRFKVYNLPKKLSVLLRNLKKSGKCFWNRTIQISCLHIFKGGHKNAFTPKTIVLQNLDPEPIYSI